MAADANCVCGDFEENATHLSDCDISAQALIDLGRKKSESVAIVDSAIGPQTEANGVPACDWEEHENSPFPDCNASAQSLRDLGRKRIERGEVWKYKETKSLLAIWSSTETQHQLSTLRRNKSVWQLIALKLKSAGYRRTWVQCKNRIANLIKLYKKAAKDNNDSSGPFRSAEPFFKELNSTLNSCPATGTIDGCEEQHYTNDSDSLYLVQSALGSSSNCLLDDGEIEEGVDGSPRSTSPHKLDQQSPTSSAGVGGGCCEDDLMSDGNKSDDVIVGPENRRSFVLGVAPASSRKRKRDRLNTYHQTMLEQFRLLISEVEKRFYEYEERREMRYLEERERQRHHEMQMELHRLEHEARESKRTEEFFKLICDRMNRD